MDQTWEFEDVVVQPLVKDLPRKQLREDCETGGFRCARSVTPINLKVKLFTAGRG